MNIWNQRNLEPPPVCTYRAEDYKIDVKRLHEKVNEAAKFFRQQHHLQAEAALLSRCIYRMKQKFRNDKGFKAMQKMNSALLRCLQLNFPNAISTLLEVIPSNYEKVTYLPTKNMVDYILVRLQSLSKLMCRIVGSAQIAAFHLENRIHIGHFWRLVIIMLAMVSRIWTLCKSTARFCCTLYSELLPVSHLLKNTSFTWLPADYHFPPNLKSWIEVDWINEEEETVSNKQEIQEKQLEIENEQLELICSEYKIPTMNKSLTENSREVVERKMMKGFEMCEADIGEVITREETVAIRTSKKKNKSRNRRKLRKNNEEIISINDDDVDDNIMTKKRHKTFHKNEISLAVDKRDVISKTSNRKRGKRKRKTEVSVMLHKNKKQKKCKNNAVSV